jgi:hypothetical protein
MIYLDWLAISRWEQVAIPDFLAQNVLSTTLMLCDMGAEQISLSLYDDRAFCQGGPILKWRWVKKVETTPAKRESAKKASLAAAAKRAAKKKGRAA